MAEDDPIPLPSHDPEEAPVRFSLGRATSWEELEEVLLLLRSVTE